MKQTAVFLLSKLGNGEDFSLPYRIDKCDDGMFLVTSSSRTPYKISKECLYTWYREFKNFYKEIDICEAILMKEFNGLI